MEAVLLTKESPPEPLAVLPCRGCIRDAAILATMIEKNGVGPWGDAETHWVLMRHRDRAHSPEVPDDA